MIFVVPTNTCFGMGCFLNDVSSYKKIYEIKGRDFKKPMAIFLPNFKHLQQIAFLSNEQINFLKNYSKPWTILVDKAKIVDKNLLENIKKLPNSSEYKKIAFRLAHQHIHLNLIKKGGYFFLTSANKAGENELKSLKKLREVFEKELKDGILKIYASSNYIIPGQYYFSDIFEFESSSTNIKYYRKN